MVAKLKKIYQSLKDNVFMKYPVTLCAIWAATLFSTVVVSFYNHGDLELILKKITVFLWLFAAGNLLTEEFFEKVKLAFRLVGFTISAILSAFFAWTMFLETKTAWGFDRENFQEFVMKVLVCYLAWIVALCIHHMYKESGETFEKYCLSIFGSVVRTSVVYGLFALGIAIIILIFDVLLFETNEFVLRIEVLLAGALYAPGVLLAVSKVSNDIGKFLRLVVRYVLLILALAAFVIIYLYIIKLIVSLSLPSNEVFAILGWLFACGLPIWTMAMHFDDTKLGKIAAKMPYAFIPFIVLQCVCVGLRIHQYGLTDHRYFGCLYILGEIIYVALFAVAGRKWLPFIFPVMAFLVTICFIVPFVNYESMTYYSQKARLEQCLRALDENGELTGSQERQLMASYGELNWMTKGKAYLEHLTDAQRDYIEYCKEQAQYEYDYRVHDQIYVSARWRIEEYGMPVSGYDYAYEIYINENDYDKKEVDLTKLKYEMKGKTQTVDISDFAERACERYEQNPEMHGMGEWLRENGEIELENGAKIRFTEFNLSMVDGKCESIYATAYYLE